MKKIIRNIVYVFAFVFALKQHTYAQIISVYAGTGAVGYAGDGGQATNAELYGPNSATVDSSGNIYFGNGRGPFREVMTTGIIKAIAGTDSGSIYNGDGIPATTARISTNQLTVDKVKGIIYIADGGNHRVRMVDHSGFIYTYAGTGTGGFTGDGGPATAAQILGARYVACDYFGNLYFDDGYRIRKVDTNHIISTVAGTGVDSFSGDGGPATAATIHQVSAICTDNKGNIYFGDEEQYRIRKIDKYGMITTFAGNGEVTLPYDSGDGGPATRATIYQVRGLAADKAGNIYYSDDDASRIRKIDTAGIITTVVGNGTSGFSGEGGPSSAAVIGNPTGICIDDKNGILYFDDISNNVVMKIQYPVSLNINEPQQPPGNVQLYPDPVLNQCFTIQLNDPSGELREIHICNALGQQINEQHFTNNTVTNVQLQNAPPGVYFISLRTATGNWNGKIEVQ